MSIMHWTNYRADSLSKITPQSSETVVPLRKRISKRNQNTINTKTFRELYKQHHIAAIVTKAIENETNLYEEYDQIKLQGNLLKLNDHVIIKNGDGKTDDYMGTIQKICSIIEPETQKLICLCQVQWYMRKSEILSHQPRARKWISESEVFSTRTSDYILAQTIIQKCTVVNCEEFTNLKHSDTNTYFNRLEWDVENKKFTNMNSLQLYCLCQQPWNPELNYIQCDKCQKWYHFACVDITESYDDEEYICGYCH